jgi:starch synthase
MLIGMVGRMTEQKGLDVVLAAAEQIMQRPVQLAMLGGGDTRLEAAFQALMLRHPGRVSVRLGYNEGLAHRIEAGSDVFLMPSRFEPCGLNQLYSLRYGTPPIVHGVGGLNDTVIDTYAATLADGSANGFVMRNLDVPAILWGVSRALEFFQQPKAWATLQAHGMTQDFGWRSSAQRYLDLYQELAAVPIKQSPSDSTPVSPPSPRPARSRAASKA